MEFDVHHCLPLSRGALSCAALLCAAFAASAQPTVVVSGSRDALSPSRLTADVVVIDNDALRRSPADSLADLLRREAGLQMSRPGGPGAATSLFLRGAGTGQTAVWIDGVRVGSATLGQPSFETLPLAQIERIEILRGPGSSLYGADAIGGVIRITTRRGDGPSRIEADAALGGYGSVSTSAAATASSGPWSLSAAASHEKSDGVSALRPSANSAFYAPYNPDADGYRLDSVQGRVSWQPVPGQSLGLALLRTRLNAQYDAAEFLPGGAQDSSFDYRNRAGTATSALDWRGSLAAEWTGSATLASSQDDVRSGKDDAQRYRTRRERASAQLAWNGGAFGQWVGAVERSDERAESSDLSADVRRSGQAAVVAWTGDAAAWSWQADARRDRTAGTAAVDTGRLGIAWRWSPTLRLRALAGTSFRAPSFNDLYYPGYGVPTVGPERGRSAEIGLNWAASDGDLGLTLYRQRVRDLIATETDRSRCPPDPSYDAFGVCARNIDRARLDGATLSASQRLGAWQWRVQFDALSAKDAATGARLQRRASRQATLSADWESGDWRAGASLLALGERPDKDADGNDVTLAAQTTIDLYAGWRFAPRWTLRARLLNATDRDIEPSPGARAPGRQAWLGLRYETVL